MIKCMRKWKDYNKSFIILWFSKIYSPQFAPTYKNILFLASCLKQCLLNRTHLGGKTKLPPKFKNPIIGRGITEVPLPLVTSAKINLQNCLVFLQLIYKKCRKQHKWMKDFYHFLGVQQNWLEPKYCLTKCFSFMCSENDVSLIGH